MIARHRTMALLAIVAASIALRLPNLDRPLADSLQSKQVYAANRARAIAKTPLNPLRSSLATQLLRPCLTCRMRRGK